MIFHHIPSGFSPRCPASDLAFRSERGSRARGSCSVAVGVEASGASAPAGAGATAATASWRHPGNSEHGGFPMGKPMGKWHEMTYLKMMKMMNDRNCPSRVVLILFLIFHYMDGKSPEFGGVELGNLLGFESKKHVY